jgi:uncharacterized membrane protein YhhN
MGLGAFLIMQLSYIGYLRQFIQKKLSVLQKFLIAFVVILFFAFTISAYSSNVSDLLLLSIYGIILTVMAIMAISFPKMDKQISIIVIGAVVFAISDFTLAIDKFLHPIILSEYIIMITYMVAQFLIVKGIADDAALYFDLKAKAKVNKKK